jgi:hypothetical protein
MSDEIVCKACGYHGTPGSITKGSFAIEVILWLCFIIPGLIYSFWRLSSRGSNCPTCGSTEVIPVDSPIGRKLLGEVDPKALAEVSQPYRHTTGKKGGLAWRLGRLIGSVGRK